LAPIKGGVEKKITLEEFGNNLLEYDFCLLLVHELPFKKTFATKKISS
jgi:hypothetical protein